MGQGKTLSKLALTALLASSGINTVVLAATARADHSPSEIETARRLGFRSVEEMKTYATIARVEINPIRLSNSKELKAAADQLTAEATASLNRPHHNNFDANLDLSSLLSGIDQIMVIGEKVWKFIVDNKPVANVSSQRVSFLPKGASDWQEMEKWQGPAMRAYEFVFRNGFGMKAISHEYAVVTYYGGKIKGHGAFLANTTIIPAKVSVITMFRLDSEVAVDDPVNIGTVSEPVPSVNISLNWKATGVLNHYEGRETFNIRGNGKITEL